MKVTKVSSIYFVCIVGRSEVLKPCDWSTRHTSQGGACAEDGLLVTSLKTSVVTCAVLEEVKARLLYGRP